MARPIIRVEGLKRLQADMRRAEQKELAQGLREANKAAARTVADEAADRAPVRSGRLRKSVGVRASQRSAAVKAGSAARVPYAGPIHYGWPARNIEGQPFITEAIAAVGDAIREPYEAVVNALADLLSSRIR